MRAGTAIPPPAPYPPRKIRSSYPVTSVGCGCPAGRPGPVARPAERSLASPLDYTYQPTRAVPILYPAARAALFQLPAETAHELVLETLSHLPSGARRLLRAFADDDDPRLAVRVLGIDFPNPIGLAAGLDKAGSAFNSLAALGFGFVEIGTVTALAQPGNPRPRLFRLTEDSGLLNRMGFNNPGAQQVADRLARVPAEAVLGINVGKSKATALRDAPADYLRSIELLERFASYLVVNISSPNTPGLRELQDAAPLRELLGAIRTRPRPAVGGHRPVLVKLAPDLSEAQLDQAVEIALESGVAGFIAVNTTVSREGLRTSVSRLSEIGDGGVSGAPLRQRAVDFTRRIYRRTRGAVPIVGVGGIFTADDAWERIRAGASLIQLYTGFIYEGPEVIGRIRRGLSRRVEEAGLASITDAVGVDADRPG